MQNGPNHGGCMGRVIAVSLAILTLVAASVACVGRTASGQAATAADGDALIGNAAGSLYYMRRGETTFALYLPGEASMESRSSQNASTTSWTTNVTLRPKAKPELILRTDSSTPTRLSVNGATFDLALGSFLVLGTHGKVEQLPFAPISRVDSGYLERLNKYLSR